MIVVVMGVSGAGKSTIGRMLADALGATFLEADDFHPPANLAKMRGGIPLGDEDRWPWLDAMAAAIDTAAATGKDVVVACSALKEVYRARLLAANAPSARIVHLVGDASLIAGRLGERAGHFMPPGLLPSQIAALEPPPGAIAVAISAPPAEIVASIVTALRAQG